MVSYTLFIASVLNTKTFLDHFEKVESSLLICIKNVSIDFTCSVCRLWEERKRRKKMKKVRLLTRPTLLVTNSSKLHQPRRTDHIERKNISFS